MLIWSWLCDGLRSWYARRVFGAGTAHLLARSGRQSTLPAIAFVPRPYVPPEEDDGPEPALLPFPADRIHPEPPRVE